MKVERRYTTAESDPYAGIEFVERTSRIVNPDGSVVFEATLHGPGPVVAGRGRHPGAEVLPQGGRRAEPRPVAEDGVPEWLQRHEPDDDALGKLRRVARRRDRRARRCSAASPAAGPTGAGERLLRRRGRARVLRRAAPCSRRRSPRPNTPQWFNTGLHWAYGIDGPPQGHYYVDPADGDAAPLHERLRAPCPARVLHPVRRRRPRQRRRHHGPVGRARPASSSTAPAPAPTSPPSAARASPCPAAASRPA